MELEIVGDITNVEVIAAGNSIREITRLRRLYGRGRWRKLKGLAHVRLPDDTLAMVEVHWYEAHGIGKKEIKIKRLIGDR